MNDPQAFAIELGRALTGEPLPLNSPEVDDVVSQLAHLGWGARQLRQLRGERQEAREVWPFPVRRDVVAAVGPAVFHARLAALRERLGLQGVEVRARSSRDLDAHERRLSEGRPPHWG